MTTGSIRIQAISSNSILISKYRTYGQIANKHYEPSLTHPTLVYKRYLDQTGKNDMNNTC
jgi:hypothetical protein